MEYAWEMKTVSLIKGARGCDMWKHSPPFCIWKRLDFSIVYIIQYKPIDVVENFRLLN